MRHVVQVVQVVLLAACLLGHSGVHAVTTGPTPHSGAYPPSCLSSPLTDAPTGPTYSRSTMFASIDRRTSEYHGFESVDLTFWRVACDGGKSALLLRIARAPNADPSRAAQFPFNYGFSVTQGSVTGTVRLAQEPNALASNLTPGAVITSSVTLILENVSTGNPTVAAVPPAVVPGAFDFNQPLDIIIPNPSVIGISPPPPLVVLSIPAYDPGLYPAASAPMAVSGYNAGSYYDPAHGGEGIVADVGDAGTPQTRLRFLSLAWFTYDQNGKALWIYGVATFTPGATTVQLPMAYFSNGGFAGAFGASAASSAWGSVTVSFPDCTSMHLSYAANPGLPAPVPSGSGERTWSRLTEQNGLNCR